MVDDTDLDRTIEDQARSAIVDIAVKNGLYFVVWSGHFGKYFHALKNNSGKTPEIYGAMYESYYDLVGDNDNIVFKFKMQSKICWRNLLHAIKANMRLERICQCR